MIIPIAMYGCECDSCGKRWIDDHHGYVAFTDECSMSHQLEDDEEWLVVPGVPNDKHYCPDCVSYDDDTGDAIIDEQVIQ